MLRWPRSLLGARHCRHVTHRPRRDALHARLSRHPFALFEIVAHVRSGRLATDHGDDVRIEIHPSQQAASVRLADGIAGGGAADALRSARSVERSVRGGHATVPVRVVARHVCAKRQTRAQSRIDTRTKLHDEYGEKERKRSASGGLCTGQAAREQPGCVNRRESE